MSRKRSELRTFGIRRAVCTTDTGAVLTALDGCDTPRPNLGHKILLDALMCLELTAFRGPDSADADLRLIQTGDLLEAYSSEPARHLLLGVTRVVLWREGVEPRQLYLTQTTAACNPMGTRSRGAQAGNPSDSTIGAQQGERWIGHGAAERE
jgi:hypothetical protein